MKNTMHKLTAALVAFFVFFSMTTNAQAQQMLGTTQEQNTATVSPDNAQSSADIQNHCAETGCSAPSDAEPSALSAASSAPLSSEETAALFAQIEADLKSLLPANSSYSVAADPANGKLKIYTSTPTKGNISVLSVNMGLNTENKVVLDMENSLTATFKDVVTQPADIDILKDGIRQVRETGFLGNPVLPSSSKNSVQNPEDFYEFLALSRTTLVSAKNGTGASAATRTLTFKANGLDGTVSRTPAKSAPPTPEVTLLKFTNAAVQKSLNYILNLQDTLSDVFGAGNVKVRVESFVGSDVKVSIQSLSPSIPSQAISRIDFTINGDAITAKTVAISTGQTNQLLSNPASEMLYAGALMLLANKTPEALSHLMSAQMTSNQISCTTAKVPVCTASVLTYKQNEQDYRVRYIGKAWAIQNVTHEQAINDFISKNLQTHLDLTKFRIDPVSISPEGLYEFKITSKSTKVPANTLASLTFKLEMTPHGVDLVASSLNATYQGITPSALVSYSLFESLGITTPGQSPAALEAIGLLEEKIGAMTQIAILKTFDPKTRLISFTHNLRDYATTYEAGVVPWVQDQTDLRYILPFEATLKKEFPGASVSKTFYPNGEYKFVIYDTSTKPGELIAIDFNVTVEYDPTSGLGAVVSKNLFIGYNGLFSGASIGGDDLNILKNGIATLSGKTAFVDILKALRTTTVESFNDTTKTFTVLFGGKRYDLKSENSAPVILNVFAEKSPTLAAWKTIDSLLVPFSASPLYPQVTALKTELAKTGGNILTSMDRSGSVVIEFFSNANGLLQTITIRNDPVTNIKSLVLTSKTLTEPLSPQQAQLYLENMTTDAATTAAAADIKAMLGSPNFTSTLSLTQIDGGFALSGTYNSGPLNILVYANKTLRIFSGYKSSTAMPTLAAGMQPAKTAFEQLDDYIGNLSLADLVQIEALRAKVYSTPASVKIIQVSKAANGTYQFTWFNDRSGTAQSVTVSPLTGTPKKFGSISVDTVNYLVAGNTKSTLSAIELYLKNFSAATAAEIKTHLDKLRGINDLNADPISNITVEITLGGGVKFVKTSSNPVNRYTLTVTSAGVASGAFG